MRTWTAAGTKGAWGAAAGVLALAAAAAGQIQPATQPGTQQLSPANLQRVDPGVGDIDPLRLSLRDLSVDLRSSGDFSNVYRLPGTTPGGSDERFVRFGGGTIAVFPRSVYVPTNGGLSAEVPPGTVFYIGGVPTVHPWEQPLTGMGAARARVVAPPPASAPRADVKVSTAARTDVAAWNQAPEEGSPAPAGVRQLLRRAAAAPEPLPEVR